MCAADPCLHTLAGSPLTCCLGFHFYGKNKDPQHHIELFFFYFTLPLLGAALTPLQPALVFLPG